MSVSRPSLADMAAMGRSVDHPTPAHLIKLSVCARWTAPWERVRGAVKRCVAIMLLALMLPAVPAYAHGPPTEHQHQGNFFAWPCVPQPQRRRRDLRLDQHLTTRATATTATTPRPRRNRQPAPPTPRRIRFQARTGTVTCALSWTPTLGSRSPSDTASSSSTLPADWS